MLDDHVHLLAALLPKQSPGELALTVMNNTSHWFRKQNPGAFKVWDVPGFWRGSAYLGTAGVVTSKQIRNYLRREWLEWRERSVRLSDGTLNWR